MELKITTINDGKMEDVKIPQLLENVAERIEEMLELGRDIDGVEFYLRQKGRFTLGTIPSEAKIMVTVKL